MSARPRRSIGSWRRIQGEQRKWLKVFETLPVTLLNAYGEARYVKMTDEAVWADMVKDQRSGAMFMTELASEDAERRGIGFNRWCLAFRMYLLKQIYPETKKHNEYIMKESLVTELYVEIDRILPSVTYCLAPQKKKQTGRGGESEGSGLRARRIRAEGPCEAGEAWQGAV